MFEPNITFGTTGIPVAGIHAALVPMIALRPLFGDYTLERGGVPISRTISPGMKFFTNEEYATSLESRGLAERYHEPILTPPTAPVIAPKQLAPFENKMVESAANKATHSRKSGRTAKR